MKQVRTKLFDPLTPEERARFKQDENGVSYTPPLEDICSDKELPIAKAIEKKIKEA